MAKAVKLSDIADVVGVSIVTVSKALANKPGVGDEMREKIKSVAEDLGYRPTSAARMHRGGVTGNIGVLIPKRSLERSAFHWELYQRIAGSFTVRGYYVILEIVDSADENSGLMPKMITDHKIDGVIMLGQFLKSYAGNLAEHTVIPVIFLDFHDPREQWDMILPDNYYGMHLLTNALIGMGHEKIGFAGKNITDSSMIDRYCGYWKTMLERKLEIREEWVLSEGNDGGEQAVKAMLRLPRTDLPTAFVCNSDKTAQMLIRCLKESGIRVPEDISVAGYDNYSEPGGEVRLATYDIGMKKIAEACADTLLKKISGENYRKGIQIITGFLVNGESVSERL